MNSDFFLLSVQNDVLRKKNWEQQTHKQNMVKILNFTNDKEPNNLSNQVNI